jgi:hypothetical protein
MTYSDNTYITAQDLSFAGLLRRGDVKKSRVALQPIFEAFTNALEAIKIRKKIDENFNGKIEIKIYAQETTIENATDFHKLSITDNGIGFNNKEFKRFNTFNQDDKGFKNLGSGRIQYVLYFDKTSIKSVFQDNNKFYERDFTVSKKDIFVKQNNAIVLHNHCTEITEPVAIETTITFHALIENSPLYNEIDAKRLKEKLIERYIHYLCYNKTKLPQIKIEFYIQSHLEATEEISQNDIPDIDQSKTIPLTYSKLSPETNKIVKTDKTEDFIVDAFKISKNKLKENQLNLVSKGEIVEESDIKLQNLSVSDSISGFRYLFLVSSSYIDDRDTNVRGNLNIPSKDNYVNLFTPDSKEIFVEDIQQEVNTAIGAMYPQIEEIKQNHDEQLAQLKEMFLLDDDIANDISLSINDSESKILEKFYEAEAKKMAVLDSQIKQSIDNLEKLDTTSDNYQEDLKNATEKLVKVIPQQNKISLTHYVARRKIVLDLFDKIIAKKLLVQVNQKRNKDEQLIHNLIFQQHRSDSKNSDLWLLNEDFIYFGGTSEKKLKDITLNGISLLRDIKKLTEKEQQYRTSLNEDRYTKRPDILLFPEENKCIIIELKNPDVNVTDHLMQINNYAALIWNFSRPEFHFDTFYGYLIGENLNPTEVRMKDGDFKEAYKFDYAFRPNKVIPGIFVKGDAALYTEVIQYSTLLERAKKRNTIFIDKLQS